MVIAHLYKDLLNLYGNDGNVKILKLKLEQMGYDVVVEEPSIGDKMDLARYDCVFIGSGTEDNLELAIKDILSRREEFKEAIESDKLILAMGNSVELFDERALNAFPFKSVAVDRIKHDVCRDSRFTESKLLGFENHGCIMESDNKKLIENQEIHEHNFFGAYLEGPILVRNPEFCRRIIGIMTGGKLDGLDLALEQKAYDNFMQIIGESEKY